MQIFNPSLLSHLLEKLLSGRLMSICAYFSITMEERPKNVVIRLMTAVRLCPLQKMAAKLISKNSQPECMRIMSKTLEQR